MAWKRKSGEVPTFTPEQEEQNELIRQRVLNSPGENDPGPTPGDTPVKRPMLPNFYAKGGPVIPMRFAKGGRDKRGYDYRKR